MDRADLQQLPQHGRLLDHGALARATDSILQLDGALVVQAGLHIGVEARIHGLQLLERESVHGDIGLLGELDDAAGDVVALAEGHALAHEVVCDLGGEHLGRQGGGHLLRDGGEGGQDAGGDLDAVADGLYVVQQGLDALLQILVVGGGQALDGHHQAGHLAECTAGLAAQELETICKIVSQGG